jgi:adiponectin receptor
MEEEHNTSYIPVFQEDFIEDGFLFKNKEENKKHSLLILNQNQTQTSTQRELKEAQIISLDKIHNYSNMFIAVHPFIMHGYRIHHNFKDCIISIFKIHNETFNIWSHLVSFIAFLIMSIILLSNSNSAAGDTAMIAVFMASSMNCFICSCIYHTYNSHSHKIATCVFKIDLFGIIMQLGCASIASQHFMFHDFVHIRNTYMCIFISISVLILIFMNIPFFMDAKFDGIRVFLLSSLFILAFLCSIHWAAIAKIEEVEMLTLYIYMAWGFMFTGFLFYFSKFPECQFQNYYVDIYLQSHTIWHWSIFLCALSFFLFMFKYNQVIINKR